MRVGDKIRLHPKTGKGKQVVHRDGDMFEILGFEETVFLMRARIGLIYNQ